MIIYLDGGNKRAGTFLAPAFTPSYHQNHLCWNTRSPTSK